MIDEGTRATFVKNGYFLTATGDNCIDCGLCIPECPTNALIMRDFTVEIGNVKQFGSFLALSEDSCIVGDGCDGACASVCPTYALTIWPNPFNPLQELPPLDDFCDLYPDICELEYEGERLSKWLKDQCNVLVPKINSAMQSDAAQWGMTVEGYVADKLGMIADSGSYQKLGKLAKNAGYFGLAYGTYTAAVAVSDGNLTVNELIGITSTALGFIALIPGVGTAVGLGGLALISAGSLVLGLVGNSDLGKNEVIADWNDTSICQ